MPDDFTSEFEDVIDTLENGFTASAGEPTTRRNSSDWDEVQRARAQYLREWEEDMRYAQELASEGM
jgi:hypothetical protein